MDIYYKAIPCTGEKKELPPNMPKGYSEIIYTDKGVMAYINDGWWMDRDANKRNDITHWLEDKIPEMTDEEIEIYNGVGVIGTVKETFAWIKGAKWYKDWLKKQLTNKTI